MKLHYWMDNRGWGDIRIPEENIEYLNVKIKRKHPIMACG